MTSLDPKIYRRAAERIYKRQNSYACDAISRLHNWDDSRLPYVSKFSRYFKPRLEDPDVPWFCYSGDPENQLARQLALLFMELIIEDENKELKNEK